MESMNVITKVNEPSRWVDKQSGKLRVCLDPQNLNRTSLRPHYPMKTLQQILPQLSRAQYFTKLDARSGYVAIKLSEESSFFTTCNTPHVR